MLRDDLVAYLDEYLGTHAMQDYGENGLQVEGVDEVQRLAFAVDTSLATIEGAVDAGAQMLIVHHGLFWGKPLLIVGAHRRRVKALLDAGCSLYGCHLPLDRHAEVGNNAQLAQLLDIRPVAGFAEAFGQQIGLIGEAQPGTTRDDLVQRLSAGTQGRPLVVPTGPELVRRVAIVSGGAADQIAAAAAAGCDTYITGEPSHSHYHDAAENGINVIYGGHYATETVGVQALARHLAARFGLPVTFIDRPTGL